MPNAPASSRAAGVVRPPIRQWFRLSRLVWAAAVAVLLLSGPGIWLAMSRSHAYQGFGEVFPHPQPAYDFSLIDQDNQPLRLHRLRGKVVLLTFGFTHCPNVCPTTLVNLAEIVKSLTPEAQGRVQVVFITVDPRRDTPDQLKKYLPFFDPNFLGATGNPEEIARTARAYGVFYEAESPKDQTSGQNYNVNHSAYAYLVDSEGRSCALYRHEQLLDREHFAKDLEHFTAMAR
jgi:protein SCO1/2